jgi:hypothetical protein
VYCLKVPLLHLRGGVEGSHRLRHGSWLKFEPDTSRVHLFSCHHIFFLSGEVYILCVVYI